MIRKKQIALRFHRKTLRRVLLTKSCKDSNIKKHIFDFHVFKILRNTIYLLLVTSSTYEYKKPKVSYTAVNRGRDGTSL